jgi:gas vesicle protein
MIGDKTMDNDMNQENNEVNYIGTFLAGFLLVGGLLLGGLIGAVVMLLVAPQSGKKTRKQIRRKGRDLRNQTSDTIEEGVDRVREKAHDVTTRIHEQAGDLQQRGQDVVDGQKERWEPVVEAGKTAVQG